jgi:hypothetical protein
MGLGTSKIIYFFLRNLKALVYARGVTQAMTSALSKQLTGVLPYIFQQTTKLLQCKFLFYCFQKPGSKRQTPRNTVTFSL